jgi:hypothetical protein
VHDRVLNGHVVESLPCWKESKFWLRCTTVHKREEEAQVYDYR